MRLWRLLLCVVVYGLMLACESRTDATPPPPVGGFGQGGADNGRLVRQVGFTGAIVRQERRFAGLTSSARRVSLIDPATEREAWGTQLDSAYDRASPLPDYSGVVLFTPRSVRILGPDADLTFPQSSFDGAFLAVANKSSAYATLDATAKQLRVVRSRTGGQWQDQSWTLPWQAPAVDSTAGAAPIGIALFNNSGTQLLVLRPAVGDIVLFAASDPTSDLQGPTLECAGLSTPPVDNDALRSVTWDDDTGMIFFGDYLGRVLAWNPTACPVWGALPSLALGDGAPITNVAALGQGRIAVTQAGKQAYLLTYKDATLLVTKTFSTCIYPLGMVDGGNERWVVTCLEVPDLAPLSAPATVSYTTATAQVMLADGSAGQTIALGLPQTAALTVDAARGVVMELTTSSLGILKVTDLGTGVVSLRKGLFLDGILD